MKNISGYRNILPLAVLLLIATSAEGVTVKRYFACPDSGTGSCPSRIPDSNGGVDGTTSVDFPVPAGICSGTTVVGYGVHLNVVHSSVGDLKATLTDPSSNSADFMNRPVNSGNCESDDIDATFLDGGTAVTCGSQIPAISGDVATTTSLLSTFGSAAPQSGNWVVQINDQAHGDDGMVTSGTFLRIDCGYTDDIFNDSFEEQ